MSSSALIPDEYSDFRTKKFWEGFLWQERGKAFEWYGDYTTLASLLSTSVPDTNAKVLVPGCGNSELSADLYDAGYEHIVNVDFSETCVRDAKAERTKEAKMRWLVMDMTDMKAFQDASFAAVVDKGSLDALMGDAEDEGGNVAGMRFLCEVRRVLDTKCGTYVIVTLCQDHVLETILDSFSVLADENIAGGLQAKVEPLRVLHPGHQGHEGLTLEVPFAVVATRKADGTGGGGEGRGGALADVSFDFETYAVGKRRGPETEQMLNCRKVVERWERRAGQRMAAALHRAERVRKVERALSGVRAGQRVELDLPVDVPGHHGGSLAAPCRPGSGPASWTSRVVVVGRRRSPRTLARYSWSRKVGSTSGSSAIGRARWSC